MIKYIDSRISGYSASLDIDGRVKMTGVCSSRGKALVRLRQYVEEEMQSWERAIRSSPYVSPGLAVVPPRASIEKMLEELDRAVWEIDSEVDRLGKV